MELHPGSYTPMQFFLTNQLHAPDGSYGTFLGLYNLFFLPLHFCTDFFVRDLRRVSCCFGLSPSVCRSFPWIIHTGRQTISGLRAERFGKGCLH
jgi:hypothetical protein